MEDPKNMDDQQEGVENIESQEAYMDSEEPSLASPPDVWAAGLTKPYSEASTPPPSPVRGITEAREFREVGRSIMPSQVAPSEGCGGKPSLVYALGMLGYDFGTEARHDSILQSMTGEFPNPDDPTKLLAHLGDNPCEASAVIWTLNIDVTPIYAIQPGGPYASVIYERLREFLQGQLKKEVERISVPGYVSGQATLLSGQVVPVIWPELRGMYSWSTAALIEELHGKKPKEEATDKAKQDYEEKVKDTRNYLDRVYYELRNLGLTCQERAMNYAATNAFHVQQVFATAYKENLDLDTIDVELSPICRPGSDCWDVKLTFFVPEKLHIASKVFRFTIDVSDVIPVLVGEVRSWFVFAHH